MARTHRLSTVVALIVCLAGTQGTALLVASGANGDTPLSPSVVTSAVESPRLTLNDSALTWNPPAGPARDAWRGGPTFGPAESASFAQRRGRGGRGRDGNGGARAAIVLGAIGAIAGGAVLVYANRPACDSHYGADGCGYGTKVVGGAVLAGGVASLTIGALTWR